jgi:hypothetical protein
MTEAAAPTAPRRDPNAFVQAWIDSLAQVLGQIRGSPLPWVALEDAPPGLKDDPGRDNLRPAIFSKTIFGWCAPAPAACAAN